MSLEEVGGLKFNENGLISEIIQNAVSGKVLMPCYINKESIEKTILTYKMWFSNTLRE